MRGRRLRGWMAQGALGTSGCSSYTDTPDVGALALQPECIQPKDLDVLVGPSFACEIVQRLSEKYCHKQRKW